MLRWNSCVIAVLATGCGRLGFDAVTPGDAIDLPSCFADDFSSGVATGWTVPEPPWTVPFSGGPDGTAFFQADGAQAYHTAAHPGMAGVTAARIELDFNVANAGNGDFYAYFLHPGELPNDATAHAYVLGIFPIGSDSDADYLSVKNGGPRVDLTVRPNTIGPGEWHHLELVRTLDGAITAFLDRAPYLAIGASTVVEGPFDIEIGFWAGGGIDTVHVDCLR